MQILTRGKEDGPLRKRRGLPLLVGAGVYHSAVKCALVTTLVERIVSNFDAKKLIEENR